MGARTLLSLEDLAGLPDDGMRYELSEGELIAKPPPKARHSRVARNVYDRFSAELKTRGVGEPFFEAAYVLTRDRRTLRVPDVSVLSAGRARQIPEDEYIEGAPDLAVEVVSPSKTAEDLDKKIHEYITAGAKVVWAVYPKTRNVHVHRAGGTFHVMGEDGNLELPGLLPGWSVKVADLLR